MIISELVRLGGFKLRNKNFKFLLMNSDILLSKVLRKTREEILIKYDKKVKFHEEKNLKV